MDEIEDVIAEVQRYAVEVFSKNDSIEKMVKDLSLLVLLQKDQILELTEKIKNLEEKFNARNI